MGVSIATIGVPVTSSRQMTTGLSPGPGGTGWRFIAQAYVLVPEWFVVKLGAGTFTRRDGTIGIYANTNFQIASANTPILVGNQLLAANGRIAFIERGLNLAYYDPDDEDVYDATELTPPTTTGTETPLGVAVPHEALFSAAYAPDGVTLYAGSQSQPGVRPLIASWDSVTATFAVVGKVGTETSGFPRYAYYLAFNPSSGAAGEVVVADGEHGWGVGSLDVATGVYTGIEIAPGRYLTQGPGSERITVFGLPNGIKIEVVDDGVLTPYWVDAGALYPYPGSGAPPSGAVNCSPYIGVLVDPPEIDWSRGIGQVLWR